MDLKYEQAQPEDIEQIYSFARELIEQYEDPDDIDISEALEWTKRKITKLIDEYVRVISDNRIAAYYHFSASEGKMELDDLYVLPEWRRRGIGTAIVRKCCGQTVLPVFLYVFKENKSAIVLYEKSGFRVIKDVGKTRCIMQREPEQHNF